MFFGAGNLVFPLMLGAESIQNHSLAAIGFLLTGILVPFSGLIAIIVFKGDRSAFFSTIGKKPAFLVTFIMLCLMGPFGAIPRCIIVAFGGMQLMLPWLPLWVFSLFFCLVNLILVWNYNRIVPIIGNILTPWLIGSLLVLLVTGFTHTLSIETIESASTLSASFSLGLFKGYQTLDLLAAFFFSATTVHYLRNHLAKREASKTLITVSAATCTLGAVLLAISYVGLVALGAKFAPLLQGVTHEQILTIIASQTLGPLAIPVVAVTIFLACLTTVAVLVTLFADFLNDDIFKAHMGRHTAIYVTLGLSFLMSLIGFMKLYKGLAAILVVLYPALIALVVANILGKVVKQPRLGKWGFWTAIVFCLGKIFFVGL